MDLEQLKAQVIANAAAKKTEPETTEVKAPVQPAPIEAATTVTPLTSALPKVKEETYQVYKSSIDNQKIAMQNGRVIRITGGKYITKNPDEIAFLDYEISQGFPFLQKGEPVLTSDLDPMSALRKKMFAEFLQAQINGEIAVPSPVLGDTVQQAVVPANTADLAPLSAGSDSPA